MRERRAGFTFIELLMTVSIIMILAAILFPVFGRAREKARQANCQSNLANIGLSLAVYATEHYGHFPPRDNDLWPLVPKCLPDPEALVCPSVVASDRAARTAPSGPPCDYIYRGGFCDDDDPQTALAGDDMDGRHNGGAGYLYLDGHVKWARPEEPGKHTAPPSLVELRRLGGRTPVPTPPPGLE